MEHRSLSWRFVLLLIVIWFPAPAVIHIWGFAARALGLPATATYLVAVLLPFLVWGFVLIVFAVVLESYLRIPVGPWLGASLVSAVVAWYVWRTLDSMVPVFERVTLPSTASHYLYLFLPAAAFGLVLAIPQCWVLFRTGLRSGWWLWPLASAIGWGGTPHALWFTPIAYPLLTVLPIGYDFVAVIAMIAWLGILPGLFAGVALKIIVPWNPIAVPATSSESAPAPSEDVRATPEVPSTSRPVQ